MHRLATNVGSNHDEFGIPWKLDLLHDPVIDAQESVIERPSARKCRE